MGFLLRTGGILLILGTLILGTGAYASVRRASIAAAGGRPADVSPGWLGLVSWVGIALMILGLLAAFAVLFLFIRSMLAPRTYVSYTNQGSKLSLSSRGAPRGVQAKQEVEDIINVLNTVLQVEYANVVNWPRWVSRITNQTAAEKLSHMARDSMRHFDTTLALVRQLGGSPVWGFELQKDETDLKKTLLGQLDKEKLAKMGYQRAAELVAEERFRKVFQAQAVEEEEHIQLLQEALSELASLGLRAGRGDSTLLDSAA